MDNKRFLAYCSAFIFAAQPALARNPDKPIPDNSGHGSITIPSLPVLTPGTIGSPPSDSNPSFKIGTYEVLCATGASAGVEHVYLHTQSRVVNGKRQMFVHSEVNGTPLVPGFLPYPSWWVRQDGQPDAPSGPTTNFKLLQPMTFQVIGSNNFAVFLLTSGGNAIYQPYVVPNSYISKLMGSQAKQLVVLGNNHYALPTSAVGQQVLQIVFSSYANGNSPCEVLSYDFNDLQINGKVVPITMSAVHECGPGCSH
ncbi:MAG TPA: hypothetical protein V6C76_03010 [Drouetiella sp.]